MTLHDFRSPVHGARLRGELDRHIQGDYDEPADSCCDCPNPYEPLDHCYCLCHEQPAVLKAVHIRDLLL